jgi:hypothetical protein
MPLMVFLPMSCQICGNVTIWIFLADHWQMWTAVPILVTISVHFVISKVLFKQLKVDDYIRTLSAEHLPEVDDLITVASLTSWVTPASVLLNNRFMVKQKKLKGYTDKFMLWSIGITTTHMAAVLSFHCIWLKYFADAKDSQSLFTCLGNDIANVTTGYVCYQNSTVSNDTTCWIPQRVCQPGKGPHDYFLSTIIPWFVPMWIIFSVALSSWVLDLMADYHWLCWLTIESPLKSFLPKVVHSTVIKDWLCTVDVFDLAGSPFFEHARKMMEKADDDLLNHSGVDFMNLHFGFNIWSNFSTTTTYVGGICNKIYIPQSYSIT